MRSHPHPRRTRDKRPRTAPSPSRQSHVVTGPGPGGMTLGSGRIVQIHRQLLQPACSLLRCLHHMDVESGWSGPKQLLSVVVPVFNEEGNVPEFLGVLTPLLERIGLDYEIIFALDP